MALTLLALLIRPLAAAPPGLPLAPRPMDLAGTVVGLLDNTKEQGDVILQTVARGPAGSATAWPVWSSAARNTTRNPPPTPLIDAMAQEVQVAVAAVGG